MQTFLKIKIKSLAAEAKIIRKEALKVRASGRRLSALKKLGHDVQEDWIENHYASFRELEAHRKWDVREESRASGIAYAFVRGKDYARMEAANSSPAPWETAKRLAKKYGPNIVENENFDTRWTKFYSDAKAHLGRR